MLRTMEVLSQIKHRKPLKLTSHDIGRSVKKMRELFPKVKQLADLAAPLFITVTPSAAKMGAPKSNTDCAFARACTTTFGVPAFVGLKRVYLIFGETAVRCETTELLRREITDNDRHRAFAPGTYRLSAIIPSERLGARNGRPRVAARGITVKSRKTGVVRTVGVRS